MQHMFFFVLSMIREPLTLIQHALWCHPSSDAVGTTPRAATTAEGLTSSLRELLEQRLNSKRSVPSTLHAKSCNAFCLHKKLGSMNPVSFKTLARKEFRAFCLVPATVTLNPIGHWITLTRRRLWYRVHKTPTSCHSSLLLRLTEHSAVCPRYLQPRGKYEYTSQGRDYRDAIRAVPHLCHYC